MSDGNLLRCIVCGNYSVYCTCAPEHPAYDKAVLGAVRSHTLPDGTVVRRRLKHLALIVTADQP